MSNATRTNVGTAGRGFTLVELLVVLAIIALLFDQLLDPRQGYGGSTMNRSAGRNCGSYPKAFSACHARSEGALGGFILYCDSHVTWKETVWKDQWPVTPDLEAPPRDDPDWYPY